MSFLQTLFNGISALLEPPTELPAGCFDDGATGACLGVDASAFDPSLLSARVWQLYQRLAESPEDEQVLAEVEQAVDRRMVQASMILHSYEGGEPPPDSRDLRDSMVNGFRHYCDGLARFRDFLLGGGEDLVVDALALLSYGDAFVRRARQELGTDEAGLRCTL